MVILCVECSDGKHLIASSGQSSIHLIDCTTGEEKKKVHCKSIGVGQVRVSHHDQCVLVSSRLKPHDIYFLCLYDNRYTCKFSGHSEYVTAMSMCPVDDTFLTAAEDRTIRRWDINSGKEVMQIKLPQSHSIPQVSFDWSGLVFGVHAMNSKQHPVLKLYDARFTGGGPFQDISPTALQYRKALVENNALLTNDAVDRYLKAPWGSFQFSHEGNHIMINTESELIWMLDGFRPEVDPMPIFARRNELSSKLGCCLSTDDRYIFTGSADNEILCLDAKSGEIQSTMMGHVSQVSSIACNPKFNMFASGCANVALWIPAIGSSPAVPRVMKV